MKNFFRKFRYLIEYIAFLILSYSLRIFSIDNSSKYCSKIAKIIGPFTKTNKIARRNLALVYKNLTKETEDKIIEDLYDNFGRFVGEFPHIHSLDKDAVLKHVEIIGIENISHLKDSNQPFLLCTGHFANWDLALRILEYLYPNWGVIYRSANNPFVNNTINKWRGGDKVNLIAKGPKGARSLLRSIKNRDSIVMLVDQKMNDGIQIPFFNIPSMTAPAIAKIALQYNYPIVPVELVRDQGCHIKVIVHKELEINKEEDSQKEIINIMTKINKILESWINKKPGQWFWFHNRWNKGG